MFQKQKKRIIEPLIISSVVFIIVSLMGQYLVYQQYLLAKENKRGKLQQELGRVKDVFRGVLNSNITVANALAVIHKSYGDSYNFDSVARQLMVANKYVDAIQITNEGVITHVYPLEGHENTIGLNTLADSTRKKEAGYAVKRNEIYFAGPRKLREGGVGILGKVPMFSNGKLIGFSVVLAKMPTILASLNIADSNHRVYSYKLNKANVADSDSYYFTNMRPAGMSVSTQIPEGEWTLTVAYSPLAPSNDFPVVECVIALIVALFAGMFAYRRIRQPYQLKEIIDAKTREISAREKYYRSITEASFDAIVLLNEKGEVLYQTPSVEKILGYSFEEMRELDGIELIHPNERMPASEGFLDLMSEPGKVVHLTHRIKSKNGNYIWIEGFYRNLLHDENVCAIVLNYHDITDKIMARHQLAERVKELTTIYYTNEILKDDQQSIREVFCKIVDILPPGWQYPEVCAARIMFEGQEYCTSNFRPSDFSQAEPFILDDGRQGTLEVIYTAEMPTEYEGPFLREERDLIMALAETIKVYFNKTSKQRELAKSEANFRSSFEHAAIGMALVAPNGQFLQVNKELCEMLGYPEKELMLLTTFGITHPDHIAQAVENVGMLLSGATDFYRVEKRYIHKNGSHVWVNLNAAIVRGGDGQPLYFVSQMENITEKKEVYNELERSEANLRSIFDNSEILYLLLDTDYNVLALNLYMQDIYYKVAGKKLAPGVNLPELLLPENRAKALEVYDKVKSEKQTIIYETKYLLGDQAKYFMVNVVPILANSNVIGLCVSNLYRRLVHFFNIFSIRRCMLRRSPGIQARKRRCTVGRKGDDEFESIGFSDMRFACSRKCNRVGTCNYMIGGNSK